ncbi:LysM peptidoglycan-binding domain-containing protein [Aestuariicella hydrocarbonica]|uniref:LysM peptidoglycan-binding domain-containing protein n=1 Tax=Pseudomaricurvus hydrocarbonicus TaxID=1470433 RepID=A0A9E5MPB3_9GAMM|nr:LysM peptidoglycan-binding domain-containing protein [Aestuariicella hydrocarbonica]NHO67940.1 LysM peptidoglycan-binding domain-containing protein [Aestuariicella hydrocarbonica]
MKKLVFAFFALCLSVSALADEVRLKDTHPDRYTVVKGDTLWDISETFLQNPWMWPEIWHVNPQIENPHLIYPGDDITLIYLDGKPRLTVERGKRVVKLSPKVRATPLDEAIPAIPLDAINNFLSRSRVVTSAELDAAPHVLTGAEQHLVVGEGDDLYARGDFSDGIKTYGVYRAGQRFIDPETNELLGLQALDIGTVKLEKEQGEVGTFAVTRTTEEIRIADRLLPNEERAIDSTFFPSVPVEDISGVIMAVEGGVSQVGRMDVVAINRGEREGVAIGNVMAIFKDGGVIRDRVKGDVVKLPEEKAGLLMVFRTFEKMSFALVLEADRPLAVLDKVHRP